MLTKDMQFGVKLFSKDETVNKYLSNKDNDLYSRGSDAYNEYMKKMKILHQIMSWPRKLIWIKNIQINFFVSIILK